MLWSISVGGIAEAELTELVIAPRPYGAVRTEHRGVHSAGRDHSDVGDTGDVDRTGSVGECAVAQLAVHVFTDGAQGTVGVKDD